MVRFIPTVLGLLFVLSLCLRCTRFFHPVQKTFVQIWLTPYCRQRESTTAYSILHISTKWNLPLQVGICHVPVNGISSRHFAQTNCLVHFLPIKNERIGFTKIFRICISINRPNALAIDPTTPVCNCGYFYRVSIGITKLR